MTLLSKAQKSAMSICVTVDPFASYFEKYITNKPQSLKGNMQR